MSTTEADVWAHFGEGGALSVDVVSRTEAEELSVRVAELEDEVGIIHVCMRLISLSTLNPRARCRDITRICTLQVAVQTEEVDLAFSTLDLTKWKCSRKSHLN